MSLRLFVAPGVAPGARVDLDEDESHYLRRVRRARDGARVDLLDGSASWSATVIGGDSRRSTVEVLGRLPEQAPARALTLLLGLPEPQAALDAITGATELGAVRVILTTCARSQGSAPTPARIERVVRASQRQCGRPSAPAIVGPLPLAAAAEAAAGARFFAWEALRGRDDRLVLAAGAPVSFAVGPEGGFTTTEAAALEAASFTPLALGPWTLRTETAALVGLARLLFAPDEALTAAG